MRRSLAWYSTSLVCIGDPPESSLVPAFGPPARWPGTAGRVDDGSLRGHSLRRRFSSRTRRRRAARGTARAPRRSRLLLPPVGSIRGMSREKATITLDRDKAALAQSLVGAASTSAVVDLALDRLIRAERLRRDIEAYRQAPPTQEEIALALAGDPGDLADDVDW